MELLIVYYALSSGRQNYTSCYCQLCSPHLSVFICPFRTLKSTQRCSLQHKLDTPLRQQVYRMFRDRIILCLDLLLMCTFWSKKKKDACFQDYTSHLHRTGVNLWEDWRGQLHAG